LWTNRERPKRLNRSLIVWAKRFLQLYPLIRTQSRIFFMQLKGAQIGELVIVGKSIFNGRLVNLKIGNQVALGRCEIALHDHVTIGDYAVINDGAVLLTASHALSDPQWKQKKKPIVIGDYAWIATNAIILPGVTIGRGAVIGAGAVVRENIPEYAIVIGNPAVVTQIVRSKELNYSPVLFNAPFEAWIGRNIKNISKQH
jgi:acetyltransferase-like isoleucine patch superfamily enzyme